MSICVMDPEMNRIFETQALRYKWWLLKNKRRSLMKRIKMLCDRCLGSHKSPWDCPKLDLRPVFPDTDEEKIYAKHGPDYEVYNLDLDLDEKI